MGLKKPFKAVPIKPGPRYRVNREEQPNKLPIRLIVAGLLVGAALGLVMLKIGKNDLSGLKDVAKPLALSIGIVRDRAPQQGDYWPGCNAARAAGTAPIYASEPGYREEMDGDGDGIACEPYSELE